MHYAFGTTLGAIYGALAEQRPQATEWVGLPFGATVWLLADEIGVPASGLAKPSTEYSAADHASALAAHLVYGATTEGLRRILTMVL